VRLLARDAVEIVEVIVTTPTGNHQHGKSLIDALLRDRVHIPLHLLSKDAATYLLQNWFNELVVRNLDWLNPVTDEGFSISEIVEHLLQQTHFADNNGFNIQFLDSKAEFSHLESCAHSSARRSWEENCLHDNDNQFFFNPDLFYHRQDQLQRDVTMCCMLLLLFFFHTVCTLNRV